jgi:small-conductance mechanosensitive channel
MPGPGRIAAVDLQEKRQQDLARQVALVKAHARPWRSIIAATLAAIAGIIAYVARYGFGSWAERDHLTPKIITVAAAAGFFLSSAFAVAGLAGKARDVLLPVIGSAHAAVVRYAILLIGGAAAPVCALALMRISVGQLILGGAVTGILIGIAGQQSLANVFAGIVLLFSRPFGVGDSVRLRSGALGGQIQGTVTEIGITYLRLDTEDGALHVPNSQVLAAAVGPAGRPAPASAPGRAGAPGSTGSPGSTASPGNAGPLPGSTGPPDGGQPPGLL